MSAPASLRRGAWLAGAAGSCGVAVLIFGLGARAILHQVTGGLAALPPALCVHLAQLLLSGLAWGAVLPAGASVWNLFQARWVREAVNSLFPVASLGGAVIGGRLLTRHGITPAEAAAGATADITGEAIAQVLFLLAGLLLASTVPHARLSAAAVVLVVLPLLAAIGGLIVAQVSGLFGWLERALGGLLPGVARGISGLQDRLGEIYREPRRVAANVGTNFLSWSLGAAEVWVMLRGLHHPASPATCYAIESLGLVARSLAFAIPGGLAAQETGFVLACTLFGLPRETGLALSLLKRLRELTVGVAGVLRWQWLERRQWLG